MTKQEIEELEKEIIRQMGAKDMTEAYLRGDWSKVDPEIRNKYVKYVVPRITETMKNLQG